MKKKVILVLLSLSSFAFAKDYVCSGDPKDPSITRAVKWYRDSAEKKALYRQIFGLGENYIDVQAKNLKPKEWGVVLDIDETTLDNTRYFKECGETADDENDFSQYIVLKEYSTALPGVKHLTCKVERMGGYVTLISNRDGSYPGVLKATIENLKHEGVCFDQVILANRRDAKNASDKNPRFNSVTSGKYDNPRAMVWSNTLPAHKVIAYFGDNIQDFPNFKQPAAVKLDDNDSSFNIFGNGNFILPNPTYGSWLANKYN